MQFIPATSLLHCFIAKSLDCFYSCSLLIHCIISLFSVNFGLLNGANVLDCLQIFAGNSKLPGMIPRARTHHSHFKIMQELLHQVHYIIDDK